VRTDILRQENFHSEISLDWVNRLAAWRGLISLVMLLIASSALWAALLWPILLLFR
jgi:hypothetical protein